MSSMTKRAKSLTEGSIPLGMFIFGLPLVLSNLVQVLFNMADIAVVGKFSGSLALGAVGSTGMLVNLFTGFLIGVSGGINVLVARSIGAKNKNDTKLYIHTSAVISLIIGLIIAVFGVIFSRTILSLMNTKPDLIDGATAYLRIYFLGMPALSVYNFGNACLSASGETKKPLYFMLFAGALNVVLNLFFVIVCNLSVVGVALATVIAQYVSAFLIIRCLVKGSGDVVLCFSELSVDKEKMKNLLAVSIPSGFQNAVFFIANIFVQIGVNSFDTVMVSGNAAASNADGIVYDVMAAFYMAGASFIGQNFGAGNKKRVMKSYIWCLIYSFGFGAAIGFSLAIFGESFIYLFTTEADVVEAGMQKLRIMGFSYCISAFMDGTIAASRGLGRSVVPMYIVIGGSCIFRLVWLYTVFAYFHTIKSLYLLYSASWTITAIAEIIYFIVIYRRECKSGLLSSKAILQ